MDDKKYFLFTKSGGDIQIEIFNKKKNVTKYLMNILKEDIDKCFSDGEGTFCDKCTFVDMIMDHIKDYQHIESYTNKIIYGIGKIKENKIVIKNLESCSLAQIGYNY